MRIVVAIIIADHACDFRAVEVFAATKHQYVVFDEFAPYAEEGTTSLGAGLHFAVLEHLDALDVVLAVYTSVGWSVVLDLLVLVVCDVLCREDVTEIAWVEGT